MTTIVFFFLGLAALMAGGALIVRGAAQLSVALGISRLVIGLTVVAYGTSSPELAVSVQAALSNHPNIILGTNVGSTIFNILFILGLSAAIKPIVVSQQLIWIEVPIMIAVHILFLVLCADGLLSKLDALILILSIIFYTAFVVYQIRKKAVDVLKEDDISVSLPQTSRRGIFILRQIGLIFIGLTACVLGSDWLIHSSLMIARWLGVSELVISTTIMAASTSLPEVVTSLVAVIRGEKDIAVGNVVGSNIFNLLGICGIAGLISPENIPVAPALLHFDLPVAIVVCLACLPIFFTKHLISRWEGVLFLGYYVAFTIYVLMAAQDHDALAAYSQVLMLFAIPLTAITLVIGVYRSIPKPYR